MKNKMRVRDTVKARCIMRTGIQGGFLKMGGRFEVVCKDANGNEKWREDVHNIFMNDMLDEILDSIFHGSPAVTTAWFIGLHNDATPLATWGTTASFTEVTAYSEGVRQAWVEGASSSQSMTNSSPASFSINGSANIEGAFLCKANSGAVDVACGANFSSSRSVANGDTVEVTYTVSSADDGV